MKKKNLPWSMIKKYTEYGIHIWAILIIANAALVYAYHFATHAAPNTNVIQQEENPNTIKTKGPSIDLTFTIPGIGSGGGTMKPKRLERNLTVYLYSPDANSLNPNVKPLYSIKSTIKFENDNTSPLYTTFSNHAIKLANVNPGDYQIVFRTDESLRTIIKESPDNVGGQIINLEESENPLKLPLQTVFMGDTIPKEGDNTIDISDYNAFINCYGERNKTDFCQQSNYGDLDDNGVIDGIDYNILLRTFSALIKQGQTIPQISITPTKKPTMTPQISQTSSQSKPTIAPSVANSKKQTESTPRRSPFGGIIVMIFLLFLGAGAFLFIKNKAFKNKILSLIPKKDVTPPTNTAQTQTATTPPVVQPESKTETINEPQPDLKQPEQATAPTETPSTDQTAQTPDDAKSYYVKKRLPDDAKTGFWLTLTDDNGAIEAHFTTKEVTDGFAKIKGTMKEENGKSFLEITTLTPEG